MKYSSLKPWSMWAIALLYFAYQFIMRLFPGLVIDEIMDKHQIDATAFGLWSSMYYFGYAGMQIPIAVLLDRYGPRRIITLCALLCSSGILLFVKCTDWHLLLLARFMIGVGSAAGFLGVSKVISLVFPESQYAKMVGLTFSFGLTGAVFGGKPVSYFIEKYGWESVGLAVAAIGFLCAVLVWMTAKIPYTTHQNQTDESVLTSLKKVVSSPSLIFLALANLLMVGSLEGFADVWGVNYLVKAFSLEKGDAAFVISCTFIGMLFGGPLLTAVSERISSYFVVCMSGIMSALMFVLLLSRLPLLNYSLLCVLFFVVGILCCYQVLIFAMGSGFVSAEQKGIAVAFLNCVNMFGGSFFHLVIGSLLDWKWEGQLVNDVKFYTVLDYTWALSAIPVCALIGGLMVLSVKVFNRS